MGESSVGRRHRHISVSPPQFFCILKTILKKSLNKILTSKCILNIFIGFLLLLEYWLFVLYCLVESCSLLILSSLTQCLVLRLLGAIMLFIIYKSTWHSSPIYDITSKNASSVTQHWLLNTDTSHINIISTSNFLMPIIKSGLLPVLGTTTCISKYKYSVWKSRNLTSFCVSTVNIAFRIKVLYSSLNRIPYFPSLFFSWLRSLLLFFNTASSNLDNKLHYFFAFQSPLHCFLLFNIWIG